MRTGSNYRGAREVVGELSYLGLGELEALQVGSLVRVKRYGLLFSGEIERLGPVPPQRDGRRVTRDLKGRTTPDLGARRVWVRILLIGRTRVVELRARDLIRAVQS